AVHNHTNVTVGRVVDLIPDVPLGPLHFRVAVLAAHEALDGVDRILRVDDRLALGHLPHQPLAGLGVDSHYRRKQPASFRAGNDYRLAAFHDGHNGVRRAQIDTDYLCHISFLSSG